MTIETSEAVRERNAATAHHVAQLREQQLAHLGGWVCNLATLDLRRRFIAKFEAQHGKDEADRLRDYVKQAWAQRNQDSDTGEASDAGQA